MSAYQPQDRTDSLLQRKAVYRRLTPMLIGAAALTILFYGWLYWRTQIWQLWIEAGALGLAILLALAGTLFIRRDKADIAGYLTVLGVAVAFLANEVAFKNATAYIAVCGALVILLSGDILLPGRWKSWSAFLVAYISLVVLLNFVPSIPRYDITQSAVLGLFIPSLTFGLVLASVFQAIRTFRLGSIRSRLLIGFVATAVIPVLITGVVATLISQRNAIDRTSNQLESVATLKESELNAWINNLQLYLSSIRQRPDITQSGILSEGSLASHDAVHGIFQQLIKGSQLFDELFIMDTSGRVILSTDKGQEGKSFAGQTIVTEGLKGDYVAPPLFSPYLNDYRIILTQPIQDDQGHVIGILAGRAKNQTLNDILLERAGLGQTGQTYLVGANNVLVTKLTNGQAYLTVRTQGALEAITSQANGSGVYANALGEQVVGVYHWMPQLQVALMAEQNRDEVLASLTTTLAVNLAVIALAVLAAGGLSLLITSNISNAIGELVLTSQRLSTGELSLQAKVVRDDEIGALAKAFNSMASQLRDLVSNLEQRVAERTAEVQQRSAQVQLASEVARDIATTTDLEKLLNQSVNLIRDRFNFYHAGIFLLDDSSEYAVLRAATGEAGRMMLAQNHKLRVGAVGIVGAATGKGEPHIALDVKADPTHYKNPLLPDTQAEIALPLRIGQRVTGALDVQSREPNAFSQEDVTVLQTMADQLAVAIENARLIQQLNQSVTELERAYGHYTHSAWGEIARREPGGYGFRYHNLNVQPVSVAHPEARKALQENRVIVDHVSVPDVEGRELGAMAVPIQLRGQVIGVLNVRVQGGEVQAQTRQLIEEAASRLALVLENARLLEEAQRQAEQEALLGQVATRVRSSLDIDSVLQTAAKEVAYALGLSEVVVQLAPPGPVSEKKG
jgi:GAF domain-containing protein/HAMP domain-containing protein